MVVASTRAGRGRTSAPPPRSAPRARSRGRSPDRPGSRGQTLCASSMTIRIGSRTERRRQSAARTLSAAIAFSPGVCSDPRSTIATRGPPGWTRSCTEPVSPPDQIGHRCRPRFRIRAPSARVAGSGASSRREARSPTLLGAASIPLSSRSTSAPYSSRSAIGSSRSTAACSSASQSVNRTCSRSLPVSALRRTTSPAAASRYLSATAESAPSRTSPSRTKSELGSSTTIRRFVSRIRRSRTVPRAYVLPDPDWPQKKVCLSNPLASSETRNSGFEKHRADVEPGTGRLRARPGARSTALVVARVIGTSWNGVDSASSTTPLPRTTAIRTSVALEPGSAAVSSAPSIHAYPSS